MADLPWLLQGASRHTVALAARLVVLCHARTIHAAFGATAGAMRACGAAWLVPVCPASVCRRLHAQGCPGHHRSHSDPSGAPGGTLFETAQIRGFWCIRVCVGTVRYGTEEHTVEKHVESRIWCEVTSFSEILGANKLRATDPASPHSGSYCRCRPASPLEEHHLRAS